MHPREYTPSVPFCRPSTYALATLKECPRTAATFLEALGATGSDERHPVLTDHDLSVAARPRHRPGVPTRVRGPPFDRVGGRDELAPRLPMPSPPWTHGQAERRRRVSTTQALSGGGLPGHGVSVPCCASPQDA